MRPKKSNCNTHPAESISHSNLKEGHQLKIQDVLLKLKPQLDEFERKITEGEQKYNSESTRDERGATL